MTTVVGQSKFNFEKSTLKVSFLWKFDGHTFPEYMEFNKRCKTAISSTEKIQFQTGFLALTNHYMQCFITEVDYNMYIKLYMGETVIPPEFSNCELSLPRVIRKLTSNIIISDRASILSEEMKNQLIAWHHFTHDDFKAKPGSTVHWFSFGKPSTNRIPTISKSKGSGFGQPVDPFGQYSASQQAALFGQFPVSQKLTLTTAPDASEVLKEFKGDSITIDIEFDYCFWNKTRASMKLSYPGEDKEEKNYTTPKSFLSTKEFFLSNRFSDFVIQCRDKVYPAHRMVIANKSLAFAAMLEQPIKEFTEGRLIIEEFEPKIVEEFLRFIYTGNANLDECAMDLFQLADKYEIADLKEICEDAMIRQLDKNNLVEINTLATNHKSQKLMDKCYSFFKLKRFVLLKTSTDEDNLKDFMRRFALE